MPRPAGLFCVTGAASRTHPVLLDLFSLMHIGRWTFLKQYMRLSSHERHLALVKHSINPLNNWTVILFGRPTHRSMQARAAWTPSCKHSAGSLSKVVESASEVLTEEQTNLKGNKKGMECWERIIIGLSGSKMHFLAIWERESAGKKDARSHVCRHYVEMLIAYCVFRWFLPSHYVTLVVETQNAG